MTFKAIKIILLNIVFLSLLQFAIADEFIFPKKKPVLSKEILEDKITKGILVPQKKPSTEETKEQTAEEIKSESKKITKLNGIIIPKSKPLVVKKEKIKIAKKSKYFSERDFSIAKKAIQLIEKSKWTDAEKVSKKAKNKSIYNFIDGGIY